MHLEINSDIKLSVIIQYIFMRHNVPRGTWHGQEYINRVVILAGFFST